MAHSEFRPVGEIPRTGGAVRGGQPAPARGRPARRDRRAGAAHPRGRAGCRAARRHRHRQVGHHGVADRAGPAAHARDGAEQDTGRAAGQRAARDAAAQRRRVLRLVLRLLPARGVHRADRHLHREGLLDQRGRRAAAALGHDEPALAARCRRRGVGVVHLRPRHPAVLPRPLGRARRSAAPSSATRCCARWSTCSTPATTCAFDRGTFRVRGDTVEIIPAYEELAVRIEFFGDEVEALYYLHPLTGEVLRAGRRAADLPGHPLRRGAGAHGARGARHRGRAGRAAGRAREPGQAAGGPAAAACAPSTTWR